MKIINFSFLLVFLVIAQADLFAGRGNPIMVIELDCAFDVARHNINTREIPRIFVDCDDMVELCPEGYTKNEYNEEECECIPDCAMLFPDYPDCVGDAYWVSGTNNPGPDPDTIGACICDYVEDGIQFVGCPPWLTETSLDLSLSFPTSNYCDIVSQPCYDGNVMVLPFENECNTLDINGMDTVDIVIMLAVRQPADPNTGYGYSVSITQLLNCELSNDQNFVVALAEQYGNEAAFVDDDNDGKIELQFLRDPTLETVIDFNQDNNPAAADIVIPACLAPAIPTLSTWTIIGLALILAISGLLFIKRKEVRKVFGAFILSF